MLILDDHPARDIDAAMELLRALRTGKPVFVGMIDTGAVAALVNCGLVSIVPVDRPGILGFMPGPALEQGRNSDPNE